MERKGPTHSLACWSGFPEEEPRSTFREEIQLKVNPYKDSIQQTTQTTMASVSRELPPTLNLLADCVRSPCEHISSHLHQRGAEASVENCLQRVLGVHWRESSHPSMSGEDWEPGAALEESILSSPSWHLPPWQMPSVNMRMHLPTLKSLSRGKSITWTETPHPQWVQVFAIFIGIPWTGTSYTSGLGKQQQLFSASTNTSRREGQSGRRSVMHTDLAPWPNCTSSSTTLPCLASR